MLFVSFYEKKMKSMQINSHMKSWQQQAYQCVSHWVPHQNKSKPFCHFRFCNCLLDYIISLINYDNDSHKHSIHIYIYTYIQSASVQQIHTLPCRMWLITDIRLHIILIAASYRQTASRKQLTDVGPIGLTARCNITFVDGWRSTLSLDITWTPDYMHHVILQTKTVMRTKCSLQYEHTHTQKNKIFTFVQFLQICWIPPVLKLLHQVLNFYLTSLPGVLVPMLICQCRCWLIKSIH